MCSLLKENPQDNGYLSTDEGREAWSNLLHAFTLQFSFIFYLRFKLSK